MTYVIELKMPSCIHGAAASNKSGLTHGEIPFFLGLDNTSIGSIPSMKNYLVMIAGAQINSYSYIRFLFKIVGSMEKKPMRKSTDNVLKSYKSLTDFRSPRARPA